jgi:VWFA-related protein
MTFPCSILLLSLLCVTPTSQSQEAPTLVVQSRLVVLDIVVTDKNGNEVNGLTKKDFTITEDSRAQTILSCEVPAQHVLPKNIAISSTADLEQRAPDMPVDVIVLDELNTRFEDTAYTRYAINKYIKSQSERLIQPTELIAVSEKGLQVIRDYTESGETIVAALNHHLAAYPWNLGQGKDGRNSVQRLRLSVAALEEVAEATSGHPGRKNVIWVGHGFPGIVLGSLSPAAKEEIVNGGQRLLDTLHDGRITLYTIDPTALNVDKGFITDPFDLSKWEDANGSYPLGAEIRFTTLATATGGWAFFSRNDVDRDIETSIRDGANFYTLSYSPANSSDKAVRFRRISVKVNRPGLVATTRNGYYTDPYNSADVSSRTLVAFDLSTALITNLKYTGIAFTVNHATNAGDNFTLYVDPTHLEWSEPQSGSLQAHIMVEAGSFGKKGIMLHRIVQEKAVSVAASDLNGPSKRLLEVPFTAEVPLGISRIRFVIRDSNNGRLGTVDATVSDSGRLQNK